VGPIALSFFMSSDAWIPVALKRLGSRHTILDSCDVSVSLDQRFAIARLDTIDGGSRLWLVNLRGAPRRRSTWPTMNQVSFSETCCYSVVGHCCNCTSMKYWLQRICQLCGANFGRSLASDRGVAAISN
jgi:hypothetical protein